ncbi:MAG: GGDEF domain-containing protein [Candidatus Manganitrophaceae bacterium]
MDPLILESIIEITRQRDIDSLEYSLAITLAEMLPAKAISIYKVPAENIVNPLEERVHLSIVTDEMGKKNHTWGEETDLVTPDPYLKKTLLTISPVAYPLQEGLIRTLFPLTHEGKAIGVLRLDTQEDILRFKDQIEGIVKIYENYSVILNESERDKLTGLLNRRTFDHKLHRLLRVQRAKKEKDVRNFDPSKMKGFPRYMGPDSYAWLAVLDVDHFKRVNDTFGHVYGDEVLLVISQKMRSSFRSSDLLFRFGGEEFVIILEPIPFESAHKTLNRFRETVSDHLFPQIGQVTVSLGFAKITENDYPPTILENADKALYYAKEHGRNCVHQYELLVEEGKLLKQKEEGSIDLF